MAARPIIGQWAARTVCPGEEEDEVKGGQEDYANWVNGNLTNRTAGTGTGEPGKEQKNEGG